MLKKITIIIVYVLLLNNLQAQTFYDLEKEFDQNVLELEKKADQLIDTKKKAAAYLQISDSLLWWNRDLEKIKQLSEQTIDLCKSKDCEEFVLDAKLNLAIIKAFNNDYSDYENFIHPTVLKHNFKNPLLHAKFLSYLGFSLKNEPRGVGYLKEAESLYSLHAPNHVFLYNIYDELTNVYIRFVNIDSASYYQSLSEEFLINTNRVDFKINILIHKAHLLNTKGQSSGALQINLGISKIYDKYFPNSPEKWAHQLNTIVTNLFKERRFDDALKELDGITKYYLKNTSEQNMSFNNSLFWCYILQANAHSGLKQYQKSLEAAEISTKYIVEQPSNDASIPQQQAYWANLYNVLIIKTISLVHLEKIDEAETYLYQLIEIYKKPVMNNFHRTIIINTINKFFRQSERKPKPAAIGLLPSMYEMIENTQKQYNKKLRNIYTLITFLEVHQGNAPKATSSYFTLLEISDTISERRNSTLSKDMLTKYETKEKEQQLDLQKIELAQQNKQRNIFIIAIIILLGFGWYFWKQNKLLKSKQQIIENQSQELQQLYDNKNRFFANIAHELRTPLTLITSPVSRLVKDKSLSNAMHQSLNIVYRNTTYLKQLINQILDLSKKETGVLSVQINQFQLADLLKALVQDFKPFADYQQIAFQTPNNLDNNIMLTTDGEKLFIILKNLLSNAFKYTNPNGQVTLGYVDMGEMLQISIQDSGRGISKIDLENVFKRYFQTSDTNAPIEGGTGIGLAVSKEYIESLNGTINVNSELGKGSTFIINFPKKLTSTAILSTEPLSFLEQQIITSTNFSATQNTSLLSTDSSLILIVEDNVDICQHLQTILQDDYQLMFAHNGVEALKQLQINTPNLILTDLMMPVMDGFELVENIKKDQRWEDIPIITLTARSEMTDKLTALRIGVDDYLVKPFHEEELSLRIKHLLDNKESRQQFIEEEAEIIEVNSQSSDTETIPTSQITISQEDKQWLEELEVLVKNRIGDVNFGVNQLSLEMAHSSSKIYRKIKRLTGLSPKEYLNQIRYAKARKLLETQTYDSIKRVAYEVGFKDEKHFSRNFKKRFGRYPSDY